MSMNSWIDACRPGVYYPLVIWGELKPLLGTFLSPNCIEWYNLMAVSLAELQGVLGMFPPVIFFWICFDVPMC